MHDRDGVTYFAGSQDADEEYYALSRSERAALKAPFIDWRLYADWNALMADALLVASYVLGESRYATLALRMLDTLVRLCVNADGSVNLRVFHPDGTDTSPAGVTLDVATAAAEPAVITDTAAADAAAV